MTRRLKVLISIQPSELALLDGLAAEKCGRWGKPNRSWTIICLVKEELKRRENAKQEESARQMAWLDSLPPMPKAPKKPQPKARATKTTGRVNRKGKKSAAAARSRS
jgi:hypothetical protein